ncbi:MAG: hypothetical protein RLY97_2116 [Pseudomonadota bacterium]
MPLAIIESDTSHTPAALASRQAEILGHPQRIEEVDPAAMQGEALDQIVRIRASVGVHQTNTIPGYFLTMLKHPNLFRAHMDMGTAIFKGEIPARERELAVLRIGWLCRAPYEWGEHVNISKRYGVTEEEIAQVIEGSTADGWAAHDAAILSAVEQLLSNQTIDDPTWATLAATWTEAQLIEFPMMVGQYIATALVQNAMRIRLSPLNKGLAAR